MTEHALRLDALLDRFDAVRHADPHTYRWAHRHDGGEHPFHLVFSSLIHGNEVGSLAGLVAVVEDLAAGRIRFGGRATFFIGNPEAGRANVRFLDADLNRVFVPDLAGSAHEIKRALEIMPMLEEADAYFDFHQTIKPARQPFYIFPWSEAAWLWVRAVQGAEVWVTRNPGQAFASGVMCADEYVRERGVPGITLELGEKGWSQEAADTTYRVITEALKLADDEATGARTLRDAAMAVPDVHFYDTMHRQAFSDPAMALVDGVGNFEPVTEGAVLSRVSSPELKAACTGAVLFPKYPPRDADGNALDPRPKEIYRVVAELDQHPLELWGSGAE
ncbi:MAG: succinylglutamate desuccinylase/aspartoacylase family protein [Deltaproteobacteria bacterium]|nr:succinylglutamate desuccinylase/aspartoacylase family protein [Deltaproteobacteria bacterium]